MDGKVISFRRGIKTQQKYQMIIKVKGIVNKAKAKSLITKNVTWKSPAGKEIKGVITKTHGNSGALRVQFEKGLPGQSLGSSILVD